MITQYQVHSFLKEQLPESAGESYPLELSLEIYLCINSFTGYTKHALEVHNCNQAKRCFALAEKLYINGDNLVQRLIENNFVYSLSLFMAHGSNESFMVKTILPDTLYKIYRKQSNKSVL